MATQASNPAKIIPHPLVWFRYFKAVPLGVLLVILAGIAGMLLAPADSPHMVRFRLMPVAGVALAVAGWGMVFRHAFFGDANPGVVLRTGERPLIAVLANMAKSGDSEPAIRIRAIKALNATGQQLPEGTRLAVVCEYGETNQNKDQSRWGDMNSLPANCFTTKLEATERLLAVFEEETWLFLDQALENLPDHKVGIYFLNEIEGSVAA